MDEVESAALALFALGLYDEPHGVLSGQGAVDLLNKPGHIYAGIDTNNPEVRTAPEVRIVSNC